MSDLLWTVPLKAAWAATSELLVDINWPASKLKNQNHNRIRHIKKYGTSLNTVICEHIPYNNEHNARECIWLVSKCNVVPQSHYNCPSSEFCGDRETEETRLSPAGCPTSYASLLRAFSVWAFPTVLRMCVPAYIAFSTVDTQCHLLSLLLISICACRLALHWT
jgi:hypothetical protein